MACWLSEEDKESLRRHRQIERQLKQDDRAKNWKKEIKIILLGAGESGKSTFLKQMRIIHGEDYSVEDRIEFRPLIYHNVLKGMKVLVEVRKRLQIPYSDPNNESNGDIVSAYHHRTQEMLPQDFAPYVEPLLALRQDTGVLTTLQRSNEFQLVSIYMYNCDSVCHHHVEVPPLDISVHPSILNVKPELYSQLYLYHIRIVWSSILYYAQVSYQQLK